VIVNSWLIAGLLLSQTATDSKDDAPPPAAQGAESGDKEAAKAADQLAAEFDNDVPTVVKLRAIAAQPYRIRIWLTIADHPRVTQGLRPGVIEEIEAASGRYLGSAWAIDYAPPPPDAPISPDAPIEDMPNVKKLGADYAKLDKVLWADVSVDAGRPGVPPFIVTVREYDAEFDQWGPSVRRTLAPDDPLPVNVFRLLHRQFRAVIGVIGLEAEQKKLRVVVKGAALQSPDSPYPLLAFGAPIKLTKEVAQKKGTVIKRYDIPWTYLIYRSTEPDRRAGSCAVMSSLFNPVDNSMLRRAKIMGLAASNSENAETEVQFVQLTHDNMPGDPPGKRPVPGYEVLLRIQDQVTPIIAGSTDRRGRITLSSANLDPSGQNRPQVCEVTLRIGRMPVANFPMVPGDEPRREVVVNADPLLPEVSGRINALQEELIDTLARQAILTKRLDAIKTALKKEDAEEDKELVGRLNKVAGELNSLPGNEYFQKRLQAIKADAKERNEKEYKQKNFGKHTTRLFAGVEKLLKEKVIGVEVNVSKSDEGN
jgi:hypothetical protein